MFEYDSNPVRNVSIIYGETNIAQLLHIISQL